MTEASGPELMTNELRYTRQKIVSKATWLDDKLFSLRVTRDQTFSFLPGQFARLGLALASTNDAAAPLEWRAYSMVSSPNEPQLEFLFVVVPDGKFSPAMARLSIGDEILIDKAVYGFLTLDRFTDGDDLWLICTGTGLSAYIAMLRDPRIWTQFKRVILVHGVRQANELAYRQEMLDLIDDDKPLVYLPITSKEASSPELSPHVHPDLVQPSRMTSLLSSGELEQRVRIELNPSASRVMLCGNPAMVTEMRTLLSARGFAAGRRGVAGNLAVENYW